MESLSTGQSATAIRIVAPFDQVVNGWRSLVDSRTMDPSPRWSVTKCDRGNGCPDVISPPGTSDVPMQATRCAGTMTYAETSGAHELMSSVCPVGQSGGQPPSTAIAHTRKDGAASGTLDLRIDAPRLLELPSVASVVMLDILYFCKCVTANMNMGARHVVTPLDGARDTRWRVGAGPPTWTVQTRSASWQTMES
jgi:hypothetical protein